MSSLKKGKKFTISTDNGISRAEDENNNQYGILEISGPGVREIVWQDDLFRFDTSKIPQLAIGATDTSGIFQIGVNENGDSFLAATYDGGNKDLFIQTHGGKVGVGMDGMETRPSCSFHIDATDALIIPVGDTADRPGGPATIPAVNGMIRYNTQTNQFEGYGPGNAWGSLGGVKDVDGDTYILAETSPTADNDDLQFYTGGQERMIVDSSGNVGVNGATRFRNDVTVDYTMFINDIEGKRKTAGSLYNISFQNDRNYDNWVLLNTSTNPRTIKQGEDWIIEYEHKITQGASADYVHFAIIFEGDGVPKAGNNSNNNPITGYDYNTYIMYYSEWTNLTTPVSLRFWMGRTASHAYVVNDTSTSGVNLNDLRNNYVSVKWIYTANNDTVELYFQGVSAGTINGIGLSISPKIYGKWGFGEWSDNTHHIKNPRITRNGITIPLTTIHSTSNSAPTISSSLTDDYYFNNFLDISGITRFRNDVIAYNNLDVSGTSLFVDNVTMNDNLTVNEYVGIGTTASNSHRLNVNGTAYFGSDVTMNDNLTVENNLTVNDNLTVNEYVGIGALPSNSCKLYVNGTSRFGNVGIGTMPHSSVPLTILGDDSTPNAILSCTNHHNGIFVNTTTNTDYNYIFRCINGTGNVVFTILTNGNAGIGTPASSSYKLYVSGGTSRFTDDVQIDGRADIVDGIRMGVATVRKCAIYINKNCDNDELIICEGSRCGARFKTNTAVVTNAVFDYCLWATGSSHAGLIVLNNGNVGIGSGVSFEPRNKLDVQGGVVIGSSYSETTDAPSNGLLVEGQVGIGTTAPTDNLEIKGSVEPRFRLTHGTVSASFAQYTHYTIDTYNNPLRINKFSTNVVTMCENGGEVGIGTGDPKNKLDVNGAVVIGSGYSGTRTASTNGLLVEGNMCVGWYKHTDYPLYVHGHTTYNKDLAYLAPATWYIYNSTQATYWDDTTSLHVSIYSQKAVYSGNTFAVSSDIRIKENITEVPDKLALDQLRQIEVKYYEYIDKISRDSGKTIGFIAQQVKTVIPMAVKLVKDYIPVMKILTDVTWTEIIDLSETNYKLTSELQDVSGISYQFIVSNDLSNNVTENIIVTGNRDNTFTFKQKWEHIFCHCKEIEDFHSLDKQKLFALNFSATQEIDRIQQQHIIDISTAQSTIQTHESTIQTLQTGLSTANTTIQSHESTIQTLQTDLSTENTAIQSHETTIQQQATTIQTHETTIQQQQQQIADILSRLETLENPTP